MLYYCPLEGYKERYTMQWSAPVTGWLERNWLRAGVDYFRVDPASGQAPRTIKSGCVLDAVGRSAFCFSQIVELLRLAEVGELTSDDVIYFDDFWTPGFEALPYALTLLGVKPKMYAFLHAQSVDEFDFTYPMRHWMRHFERGMSEVLDGIFVCGPCLRDLVVLGGIAPKEKVHITGHPFCSEEVMERMPTWYRDGEQYTRQDQVIFSSRWDREKNPSFFLDVARCVLARRSNTRFVVCSSALKLRSNDQALLELLEQHCHDYPGQIVLREGLSKEEYYAELCRSKVQMNTASQDFVAITLLEASVAGCYPVYPWFRSFPETFLYKPEYMYQMLHAPSAADMVCRILDRDDLWTTEQITDRAWIYNRFDSSWIRMLNVMGLMNQSTTDPYSSIC